MGADQHHQATVNIIFFFKKDRAKLPMKAMVQGAYIGRGNNISRHTFKFSGVNGSGRVILFYYFFIRTESDPIKFGSKNFDPYLTGHRLTDRPNPTRVK
jgi:hypothetical protein